MLPPSCQALALCCDDPTTLSILTKALEPAGWLVMLVEDLGLDQVRRVGLPVIVLYRDDERSARTTAELLSQGKSVSQSMPSRFSHGLHRQGGPVT